MGILNYFTKLKFLKTFYFIKISKFKYYSANCQIKRGVLMPDKAQAALEFLMTYGWAILVVLIAVAALAYFGVLSPSTFFPDKCILPAGITCLDYKVESYRAIIVLQNNLGGIITIDNVTISANDQKCYDDQQITLSNNEKAILTITECNNGESSQKFDGMVNITYTPEDKLTHNIAGTLKSKVVEGSSISSQDTCQNAQDNSLCDGLDLVYGTGYQSACCSEHSLCC